MKIHSFVLAAALAFAILLTPHFLAPAASAGYNESVDHPTLTNPVTTDRNGTVELQNDALLDFIIPEAIQGTRVETIGDYAFEGCDLIRTVSIPSSVTSIGQDAFANCPYLQAIFLEDRANMEGLSLGVNWAGDAQVVFEEPEDVSIAPSAEKVIFDLALEHAASYVTVDASNLISAKEALDSLCFAYEALPDTECTRELNETYHAVMQFLSLLIQNAESSLFSPAMPEVQEPFDQLPESSVTLENETIQPAPNVPEELNEVQHPYDVSDETVESTDCSPDVTADPQPDSSIKDTIEPIPDAESACETSGMNLQAPDTQNN